MLIFYLRLWLSYFAREDYCWVIDETNHNVSLSFNSQIFIPSLSSFPCGFMLGPSGSVFCLTLKGTFWTFFFLPFCFSIWHRIVGFWVSKLKLDYHFVNKLSCIWKLKLCKAVVLKCSFYNFVNSFFLFVL